MGRPKAFSLKKVSVQLVEEPPLYADFPISKPMDAVRLLTDVLKKYDREVVAVVNLQTDNRPINMSIVSMGTLNSALASPRDIMKCAILSNAASVLMVHNHVSGTIQPSVADIAMTDKLHKACNLLDIPVLDHIIIGHNQDVFSFREKKILSFESQIYEQRLENVNLQTKVAEKTDRNSVLNQLQDHQGKQQKPYEGRKTSWKGLE